MLPVGSGAETRATVDNAARSPKEVPRGPLARRSLLFMGSRAHRTNTDAQTTQPLITKPERTLPPTKRAPPTSHGAVSTKLSKSLFHGKSTRSPSSIQSDQAQPVAA